MSLDGARCRLSTLTPPRGTPNLWESGVHRESASSVEYRHARAAAECRRCPVLDACEERLSDYERRSIHIDGITAGRLSDVRTAHKQSLGVHTTTHCRICRERMLPQAKADQHLAPGQKLHAGEGLCMICFRTHSRAATHPAHHNN